MRTENPLILLETYDKNGELIEWGEERELIFLYRMNYLPRINEKFIINIGESELENNFNAKQGGYKGTVTSKNFKKHFYYGTTKLSHLKQEIYAFFIVKDVCYILDEDVPFVKILIQTDNFAEIKK